MRAFAQGTAYYSVERGLVGSKGEARRLGRNLLCEPK